MAKAVRKSKKGNVKEKVNRSGRIREILTADPNLKGPEVVAKMAEEGLTVTPVLVSQVRARLTGGPKKRGRKSRNGEFSMTELKAVADMTRKLGGIERAVQIMSFLDSLAL